MKKIISLLTLVYFLLASQVSAGAGINVKYYAFLKGNCVSAKVSNKDISEICRKKQPLAIHYSYKNEYSSFSFTAGDGNVSFAGVKINKIHKTRHDLQITRVTRVINKKIKTIAAEGICSVLGDVKNLETIHCEALDITNNRKFEFKFKSTEEPEYHFTTGYEPSDIKINIKSAIYEFDRVYTKSGVDGVQKYLESCYDTALKIHLFPTLVKCSAIDFAGMWSDIVYSQGLKKTPRPFFRKEKTEQRVLDNIVKFNNGRQNNDVFEKIVKTNQMLAINYLKKLIRKKIKGNERIKNEQ